MANDKVPTIGTLDKPEKLDNLLKADRGDDCQPCRIVGKCVRARRANCPRASASLSVLFKGHLADQDVRCHRRRSVPRPGRLQLFIRQVAARPAAREDPGEQEHVWDQEQEGRPRGHEHGVGLVRDMATIHVKR